MKITGYKPEDFKRIMEITDACYSGIYRPSRDITQDYIEVSDIFVARAAEVVGFAIVHDDLQPHIWNIAVDPLYQGEKIGTELLRHMTNVYARTYKQYISLHCNVNNPAQRLYFKEGFRVREVMHKYFDPDDGLLMVKTLE